MAKKKTGIEAMEQEKNNYDDLMNAAKQQLEFQNKGTINDPEEDIYKEFEDESEELDEKLNKKEIEIDHNASIYGPEFTDEPNYEKEDYYIDPDDTPVFDGGPGISKVQLWKAQFGIDKVYHTVILDRHFIFRTLNRAEFEQIAALQVDALTNEEVICKTCVLWPFNYNYDQMGKDNAGIPSRLSQIIMEYSGFTDEYQIEVL